MRARITIFKWEATAKPCGLWLKIKAAPMPWGRIGAALWLSEFLRRNETYFRSHLHSLWSQPWRNVSPAEREADSRLIKGENKLRRCRDNDAHRQPELG